jgi:thiol-disulfide isomerase/thioredoxin
MAERKKALNEVRFWTPLRLVSTVIVLGLLAAFGVSSCNSNDPAPGSKTSSNRPTARVNRGLITLPRQVLDAENKAASGTTPIKLADYSGKVFVINLWATWCGPCRMETPALVQLHKEYQSRGVEMVALSTEDPDASAQTVMQFMRDYSVNYHVGWAQREVAQILMQGRTSIPQSFVIGRDGRIVDRFVGFDPNSTPARLKKALDEALVEKG